MKRSQLVLLMKKSVVIAILKLIGRLIKKKYLKQLQNWSGSKLL